MKRWFAALTTFATLAAASTASADTFGPGSLIIPADTTFQDQGMLRAFGLVYKLLAANVPVRWVIRSGKASQSVDFTTSATDLQSNTVITNHGYRGGPWVIDQADAAKARPIITAFQAANPTVKVHAATSSFSGDVSRLLVSAPTIAMHADKNQAIAVGYLTAAGIPDSTGDYTWAATSPDLLTPAEVAGPTTTNHHDGALFDAKGNAAYCQFMSMHWGVTEAEASPETVAEVREFLHHPVHFFAECQAVNAFENLQPYGFFLTKTGFLIGSRPNTVDFLHADQPFVQLDGPFATVGGSEPSYSIPTGGAYKNGEVVMITAHGTPVGTEDIWMTGYLDGVCPPTAEDCGSLGKISYLGGHSYTTKLPMSTNPTSQGTRLFLNSLFEAPCATSQGQPVASLVKTAPTATAVPNVTFQLTYGNLSSTVMTGATVDDPIPAGSTFVSATDGGTFSGGAVHWNIGSLSSGLHTVSFTVTLPAFGSFANTATLSYKVGISPKTLPSNTTHTIYGADSDQDGTIDQFDTCPSSANPLQDLQTDPDHCGSCQNACATPNATPLCVQGSCVIAWCTLGYADCDSQVANGCEYPTASLQTDPMHCGSCSKVCSYPQGAGACTAGTCSLGTCKPGFSNCNGDPDDGCEYSNTSLQTDSANCGSCGHVCAAGFVCTGGSCVVNNCPAGSSDCNGLSGDGCEFSNSSFQTDPTHCGSCGGVCLTPHATAVCTTGSCAIGSCSAGFSDCNGVAVDGCEYDNNGFATDATHCGNCSTVCSFQHAVGACSQGACLINGCMPGFSDCNAAAADGCEYDNAGFASDSEHCGSCNPCAPSHSTGACAGGKCSVLSCDTGWFDLDHLAFNGCEYSCVKTGDTDLTCDGIDNDCNGLPDDGYVPSFCGKGSCQSAAKCVSGTVSCVPGSPSTEGPALDPSCSDNADNDCNGMADGDDPACVSPDAGVLDSSMDSATADAAPDVSITDGGPDTLAQDSALQDGDSSVNDVTVADSSQDTLADSSQDVDGAKADGSPADSKAQDSSSTDGAMADTGKPTDGANGDSADLPAGAAGDEGGCACSSTGSSSGTATSAWLVLGALAVALRIRRRRSDLRLS